MNKRPYSKVLNFAWYQLLWFTAVLGGAATELLLAPLLALHIATVRNWQSEFLLMCAVAVLGASFDTLLTAAGYFAFAGHDSLLPIPFWLIGIWMGFAGTLRHSMSVMVAHPKLMTAAAAVFAPLTYLAAQRFGAVTFPLGNLPTAIVIGLTWFTLTPALLWLTAIADGNASSLFRRRALIEEHTA